MKRNDHAPDEHDQTPTAASAREAVVAILGAADAVRRRLATVLQARGVSSQQYNVLRILRGVHPDPLPTLEVGERMMEKTPGVTRLLDRLETKGLVRRERSAEDRRRVHCWITEEGLTLLGAMDVPVAEANIRAVAGLDERELRQAARLLGRIRRGD